MRNRSVLLVEDDENDIFFIKDALQRSGVSLPLTVAHDGQEAIDMLASAATVPQGASRPARPGLVLLDLNLPRRNGLEVLKWIRQESAWKTLIVIVLTSSTADVDIQQAYALGANSYLVKPTDATKLREITKLLQSYWLELNQVPSGNNGG